MNEHELGKYFEFDQADLEANRNGRLTDKQKQYFAEDVKYTRMIGWGCSAIFLLIALILPIITLVGYLRSGGSFDAAAIQHLSPVLALGGILVLMALLMVFWMRSKVGGESNVVLKQVTGPINIVAVERRHDLEHPVYIAHELHIGDLSFDVKKELGNLMQQGDHYAVYYTEGQDGSGKLVQSVERLP